MDTTLFILTNTDIDTINDIDQLIADGGVIPQETAVNYLRFLSDSLKAQAGETKRILNESTTSFLRATENLNRATEVIGGLQFRIYQLTDGAEGKGLN